MKFLFILLTAISTNFAQAATNTNGEITPAAIKAFSRTFNNAQEVTWTASNDLSKVSFQINGQYATAFYSGTGEMVAITRNISPLQLPVMLLATIKSEYTAQWISELIEVSDETGTHYYVTLEDADQKVTLKSNGIAAWSTFQKVRK